MEKINLRTVSEILSESEMKQTGGIARGCVEIYCKSEKWYAAECYPGMCEDGAFVGCLDCDL